MNTLQFADYMVFLVYFFIVAGYGYWIYKRKQSAKNSASHDYFLAEGSLTWWAIGTSLIASNISSEQFIAMSGNGFKMSNKREDLDTNMADRDMVQQRGNNPFLSETNYVNDVSIRDQFLKPISTSAGKN
jgi:hypothetical protein